MRLLNTRLITALLVHFLAAGAVTAQAPANPGPPIKVSDLNRSYGACTDFYRFSGGGWLASNPVPAAFASWSPFTELTERNNLVLRDVLETAARNANTTSDPNTKKLGTFYASCMDSTAAELAGAKPLESELSRIAAITTVPQLAAQIGRLHALGLGSFFGFGSAQDAKDSKLVIVSASQGGLGLPNREYYTKADEASERLRREYVAHAGRLFELVGQSSEVARSNATKVMALEVILANASKTPVQLRDPNARYNPMTIAQANALTPAFDWSAFISAVGLTGVNGLNVAQPDFFRAAGKALTEVPLDDWKAYLALRVIQRAAPLLSSSFVNEGFAFTSKLSGARQMQPRWRRCLNATDGTLGDALGQEYVKVAFTPAAKAKAMEMIANLRAAMGVRIGKASWMSEATRRQALQKLASFNSKIGYPDTWRDYSALSVQPGPYAVNALAAREFEVKRNLAKVSKPVDRNEWFMTPPTVNAYYSPPLNEIAFPAGRLQPPFFHPSFDEAANYGGIGATIGHELSHGFDDSGRQYDAQGNLRDWWTPEDARGYTERAAIVEQQYNGYTVLDSLHVSGKLTLGENLADLVGVSLAYDALQKALAGKPRPLIDGFTPEQRFFLGWAQARRGNVRPEQARLLIQTDSHAPGEYRVNGPLSNMPEFAAAFACKQGDKMVRPETIRARIW